MTQFEPIKSDFKKYDTDSVSGLSPAEIEAMPAEDAAVQIGISVYKAQLDEKKAAALIQGFQQKSYAQAVLGSMAQLVPSTFKKLCHDLSVDLVGKDQNSCTAATTDDTPWPVAVGNLVSPEASIIETKQTTMKDIQKYASSSQRIFLPAYYGIMITPDGNYRLFTTSDAGPGNVYDLPNDQKKFMEAETSGVLICGATTISVNGYKILTHAPGPSLVRQLTARGLQLAKEAGAKLDGSIKVEVYTNPEDQDPRGFTIYRSDDRGYVAPLAEMGNLLGLDLEINHYPVNYKSIIAVH